MTSEYDAHAALAVRPITDDYTKAVMACYYATHAAQSERDDYDRMLRAERNALKLPA